MRLFLLILIFDSVVYPSFASTPSIFQCVINGSADRSHDDKNGWIGALPKIGKPQDKSTPFEIGTGGTESGYVFTNLHTDNPRIVPLMAWKNKDGSVERGVETPMIVVRRTSNAIFLVWEFGPNEFYTAVLHLQSKRAAISQISTCRGSLCNVGIKAVTADCR